MHLSHVSLISMQQVTTYKVAIMHSKAHIPFHLAVHLWFEIHGPKGSHRYEIGYWPSVRITTIEEANGSLAQRIHDFIKHESINYPYKDRYWLYPGPNSNAYIGWVLRHFPEYDIKLPYNAFGVGYK
jgi:hypothetical protein